MPIEQELEKLHEHLKALGSAREKLDGATEHIANVSDAIVNAGESMRRLAEMPELTERIRLSVERLINESKGREILSTIGDMRDDFIRRCETLVQGQKDLCEGVGHKCDALQMSQGQLCARLESKMKEELALVKHGVGTTRMMLGVVICLAIITLIAFAPLIYKVWVATLK